MKIITPLLAVAFFGLFYFLHRITIRKQGEVIVKSIKKLDSCRQVCDSLNSEVFAKDIQIGRYEYAIDRLKDENPKAYQALDEILLNTE